jgi:hypothetical protein
MGGWCKERYNKDENNKLEGLHQKPDQMEEIRWEGQNVSEVVAPQDEEEADRKTTSCTKYEALFNLKSWNHILYKGFTLRDMDQN